MGGARPPDGGLLHAAGHAADLQLGAAADEARIHVRRGKRLGHRHDGVRRRVRRLRALRGRAGGPLQPQEDDPHLRRALLARDPRLGLRAPVRVAVARELPRRRLQRRVRRGTVPLPVLRELDPEPAPRQDALDGDVGDAERALRGGRRRLARLWLARRSGTGRLALSVLGVRRLRRGSLLRAAHLPARHEAVAARGRR